MSGAVGLLLAAGAGRRAGGPSLRAGLAAVDLAEAEGFAASLAGDRVGRDHLERNGVRGVECGDLATGRDDDGTPSPGGG